MKTPAAEVQINEKLVQAMLQAQFPELAHLQLTYFNEGWDNAIYQLGERYLIRLPRRSIAVPFIEKEQAWLSRLAKKLPIPIPAPLHQGKKHGDYPWPWSITPWFDGHMAAEEGLESSEALRLAQFLKTLHQQTFSTPPPHNPHRATPLVSKAEGTEERLDTFIQNGRANTALRKLWDQAVQLNCPVNERCVIHGDLHPKNIICTYGYISAVIDWGDLTLGDPATDLAAFWLLFPDHKAREEALQSYGVSPTLRLRAMGWALFFSAILLDIGLQGDHLFEEVGQGGLDNLAVSLSYTPS
ncbi:MAG: aminoglycoside phosphotransferase family protein [Bacteroidota bacterium]